MVSPSVPQLGQLEAVKHAAVPGVRLLKPQVRRIPDIDTLRMDVTVAANSRATTIVPMGMNSASVTIAEGSTMIWKNGAYVAGGVMGVTGAVKVGDTVAIEHGSGTYSFVRAG